MFHPKRLPHPYHQASDRASDPAMMMDRSLESGHKHSDPNIERMSILKALGSLGKQHG